MIFFTNVFDDGCVVSLTPRSPGEWGVSVTVVKDQKRGGSRGGGSRTSRIICIAIAVAGIVGFGATGADAALHGRHHIRLGTVGFAPALISESIVLDADTGR